MVEATVRDHLERSVADTGNISDFQIIVSPTPYPAMPAETEITVTVVVEFEDVTWVPGSFLGSAILRSKSTMKRE